MFLSSDKFFAILENQSIPLKDKEKLVDKKKKLFVKFIGKLRIKDLLYYIFESNIPKSIKLLISQEVDNLVYTNSKRLKDIKKYYIDNYSFHEEDLYVGYYPKELKKVIVENIYKGNIIELLCGNSIPFSLKKLIIDVKLRDADIVDLLKANVPSDVYDYVYNNKFDPSVILFYLIDFDISKDLKKKVIKEKINMDNLFSICFGSYCPMKKEIFQIKENEINQYVNNLDKKEILEVLDTCKIPDEIKLKVLNFRFKEVEDVVKDLDSYQAVSMLLNTNYSSLANAILKYHTKRIYFYILGIDSYDVLRWLNNKNVPVEMKNYILKRKGKEIEKAIERVTFSNFMNLYISDDSFLPKDILNKIYEKRKDDFNLEIDKMNEEDVFNKIAYGFSSFDAKIILINRRINQDNVFKLLKRCKYQTQIIDFILKLKKEMILNTLKNLDNDELFTLFDFDLDIFIKERVLEQNINLLFERIRTCDSERLYEYLGDQGIISIVKSCILNYFGIDCENVSFIMYLIQEKDGRLFIDNYKKLKSFFEVLNIDFKAFIQYGSGSIRYRNWLYDIIDVIDNDKVSSFILVKDYFFNNYYSNEGKENMVNTINNLLELLHNYCNNEKLLLDLTSSNRNLSDEDKSNIKFLFNNNHKHISSIEELNNFRVNLYNDYRKLIDKNNILIYELKQIFNRLLFNDSVDILENIGGVRYLKMLKMNNKDSVLINKLADELILYATIIEMVNDSNDINGLKSALKYILGDNIEDMIKMQNLFLDFDKKVKKLFELDSQVNLTKLDVARDIDGVIKRKDYGEVFDFSDKNYCLYAHVLSLNENIEDLLKGKVSGNNNFISVSPISYMGQKYYYDLDKSILAFDSIPVGSFVCSSINNMGSNYSIKNNSSEVLKITRHQRGILETSSAVKRNSEALLYREGLIPCGIVLPGGRCPTDDEITYHKDYGLPFIVTQDVEAVIDNPSKVFKPTDLDINIKTNTDKLEKVIDMLSRHVSVNKKSDQYTGREVAIITDCHSMYEPTLAVLEDIRRKDIKEIYSLGDNIGLGPNPCEVYDLLDEYNVLSIAGNSEYYNTLGIEPFSSYFDKEKKLNQEWTYEKLGSSRINGLKLYPACYDIKLGDKKIALCHFANDVRWDFTDHSTWTYQSDFKKGISGKQFLYTNSDRYQERLNNVINSHKKSDKAIKGYLSSKNEPLFDGKLITDYDSVIQGHVHFDMIDRVCDTDVYTLRAVGMGYNKDDNDTACYYVLKERCDGGFDIEKRLVKYNKNCLLSNIKSSSIPYKERILRYQK